MEEKVIDGFSAFQKFWKDIGVTAPLFVGVTLTGVKNWKLLQRPYDLDAVMDRDVISSSEVIVSDLNLPADVLLHPVFDFVWNGGGWPASPNYRNGRWSKPFR